MANTPKKMKDPTEAALSAIQDALHVRDVEPSKDSLVTAAPPPKAAGSETPAEKPWPGLRSSPPAAAKNDLFDDEEARRSDAAGALRQAPANDDRESIGQILRALQRRPARTSYVLASIFAAAWTVGALGLGWLYFPDLQAALGPSGLTGVVVGVLAAIFLAPVVFFYFLAHMAWRSQELRLIAQSMAEVAMRLAEPETVARESIVTVGQAIRREVAAMGDGVERALARAAELETLVANEVSALEHAYNDNEVRIRALLQDLGGQRDTLVGQAEQIRDAINGVHLDLSHDISQISQLVAEQVNDAARRITHTLAEKGEHITVALGTAGDTMIGQLSERGGDLLERLEATAGNTSEAITAASDRLTATLNFKTDHIGDEFTEIAANLQHMMSVRLDRVADGFSQKSAGMLEMMADRTKQLTELVVETGNQLAEAITSRVEEVNTSLKTTGDSLVLDLSLRGGDVVAKMEQIGAKITESIVERGNKVSDTFRERAESLAEIIGTRGDAVRDMLATRLQSFEDMFNHGGSELAERISRDSATLGNLITRHLGEFDRTVKTYGGEMVERLGDRTQEIATAMREYLDNFDTKVTTKAAEVTTSLDQQFVRFHDAIDGRTQTLNDVLGSRVMDIAKTLAEGGKEVVSALDKRITDATGVINVSGAKLADTISAKIDDIDRTFGERTAEVANTLETRISRFEELLVGRAQAVTQDIEIRSTAAANVLSARMEQFAASIKTNTGEAERSISDLATATSEVISVKLEQMSQAVKTNSGEAERSLTQLASNTTTAIRASAQDAERSLTGMSTGVSNVLKQNASEVERTLLGVSAEVARSFVGKAEEVVSAVSSRAAEMTRVLDEKSTEVEKKLLGVSAEVARSFVGKADEITTALSSRAAEMKGILDDKSGLLINTLSGKSQELANEVGRVTDHAVKAIEAKGFIFTQTMMDNSEQIARLINEASAEATVAVSQSIKELNVTSQSVTEQATGVVTRSIKDLQDTAQAATTSASSTIARTLQELQQHTHAAVEQSKQTAAAAVSEMLETHGMLRSDTTALFERLREANILLQEVLSGAHENMGEIEATLVTRVADFVAAMNDVAQRSGAANDHVERNIESFKAVTAQTVTDLTHLATQFDNHGRALAEAVALIDQSNRRTENSLNDRRDTIETLVADLDGKADDLDQRLTRFSSLLDQSLEGAAERAREVARLIADSTNEGTRAIAEKFEMVRTTTDEQHRRTTEAMRAVYQQATGDSHAMFTQAAERFAEVVDSLKHMTAEMQRELDATRAELRKGILELPQETADSAAQMRRVIVDQIEALAELNRIVARHGRGLDAVEPGARRVEAVAEAGGRRSAAREETVLAKASSVPRSEAPRSRAADITGMSAPAMPNRRAEAPPPPPPPPPPPASPGQGGGRTGWLSDLLTRASQDIEPPPRETSRRESAPQPRNIDDRVPRHGIESIDSLSVDIARMIDHDVATDLWERYKRGERNLFTRKLYTTPGQRAFDEIRRKYRGDREFKQTVDRYIAEFERLLNEVSRDDRGQTLARTYLTSETGKVYTMLGHAAGRFE